jgi:hypothetical protein
VRVLRFIVTFAVVVLFIYPFESLQAPTWDVSVVNASNDPVSGARVRESYRDYSAEFEGGEADLITDFQGKGTFPAKTVRANILKRIAAILSSATAGAHASFGPHAYVFAFGGMDGNSVKNGVLEDWTGSPRVNTSVIVVHPTVSQ